MTKLQVIGLPGAGKSTAIARFLNENNNYTRFRHLDIRFYQRFNKEEALASAIENSLLNVIAESACGVSSKGSIVVKVESKINVLYHRLLERDGEADVEYLNALKTQMIPAHYTLNNAEDLTGFLKLFFEGK